MDHQNGITTCKSTTLKSKVEMRLEQSTQILFAIETCRSIWGKTQYDDKIAGHVTLVT